MKLKRQELKEKLGLSKEQTELVLELQEKLPILFENEEDDNYKVNARALHVQLGVGRDFSTWVKGRISKYGFIENQDYTVLPKSGELENTRFQEKIEYILSLDMAKELCMVENNELARKYRKYFIIIEKAIKDLVQWNKIRCPEKELYKEMCKELDRYFQRNFNKRPVNHDYSNEADAINLVCLGARAKQILAYFDTQDKNTREHLLIEYNTYLLKIQELNIMYLKMNIEKMRRYDLIKQGFKVLYPHASYVMANKAS